MKKTIALLFILIISVCGVFAETLDDIDPEMDISFNLVVNDVFKQEGGPVPGDRPSVALVLSGGGAKGIAHIAIIEALEEYGIPIDKVFGTSMGALIGGLYCAGLTPREIKDIVRKNDLTKLFTAFESEGYKEVLDAFDFHSNNVLSISLGQGIGGISGLIDDYLVLNFLSKCIGNVPDNINFDYDLVVPFECNAANMLTGEEMIFREGSLITAMRASMSLPLIFEPVVLRDGTVLMDGGIVSNYIVHRAVMEGYDIIIVVTLNGYGRKELTEEDYSSLSGVLGSTLSVFLNNVSRGEVDLADYWFSPDLTGYGTLSFASADGILERGYIETEDQKEKLEDIASRFTEEQKVFKNPDRLGEYYIKYAERAKKEFYSTKEQRHEDLLGRTRLSLGLYGSGGYGFFFKKEAFRSYTRRVIFTTLSLRSFLKDVGGSPVSLDVRLKLNLNRTSDISAMGLLNIFGNTYERLYGMVRARASIGSLTFYTDKNEPLRINTNIEKLAGLDAGFMLTNEYNHSIKLYASADLSWTEDPDLAEEELRRSFTTSATLETVFYPGYTAGFFSDDGTRIDIKGTGGFTSSDRTWSYKIALAAERTFKINDKFAVWGDAVAVSSRGRLALRSTFEDYGGWDGMPGYCTGSLMAEYITAGLGVQVNLSRSFASSYIAFVVRGGIRSDVGYGWMNAGEFGTMVPFKDCFDKNIWEVGASVGYGFRTPIGDIILGAGFNSRLQMSLYLELT